MVQWLRLNVSNAGGMGLILGWGTKIPHAAPHGGKINKNKWIKNLKGNCVTCSLSCYPWSPNSPPDIPKVSAFRSQREINGQWLIPACWGPHSTKCCTCLSPFPTHGSPGSEWFSLAPCWRSQSAGGHRANPGRHFALVGPLLHKKYSVILITVLVH